MSKILSPFRRIFTPIHPVPPGIYHYQAPPDDPRNYRIHLRIEPDGSGVLILNASTILHLNQTAAEYAYYFVQNTAPDLVARKITSHYQVNKEQAIQDYRDLADRLQSLIETPDLDPVTFMDFERQMPYSGHITAPYRLDCALTYRLDEAAPGAAPVERVKRELSTEEWKRILDTAWMVGIPHVVFTGGEPTLRPDLSELIAHAEANSQVAGLISDGLRLADAGFLDQLLSTGLDHLMMIFQPEKPAAWEALSNALGKDLYIAVHLTLTSENASQIPGLLKKLKETGVVAISLSASEPALNDVLQSTRERLASMDLELVWNLPTPYSALHPIALETKMIGLPEGAGRAWLYIEPDGDVLPAQGVNRVLGNMLNDPWDKIWKL
jgi:hypothetical protein